MTDDKKKCEVAKRLSIDASADEWDDWKSIMKNLLTEEECMKIMVEKNIDNIDTAAEMEDFTDTRHLFLSETK